MLHSLARIVEPLLQPITVLWLAALVVTVRLLWRRRWRSAAGLGMAVVFAWVIGATPFSAWCLARLERPYLVADWTQLPVADAALALGGTLSSSPPDVLTFEVGGEFDRLLTALELVRRGKAGSLVLSGGGDPTDARVPTEVNLLKRWLTAWELPKVAVHDLGICRNTREEAEKMGALMKQEGWKKILLVSSAYHMSRSEGVFRSAGVEVVPVACDFRGVNELNAGKQFYFLPRMRGFQNFETWFHELSGTIYYRWRGWIR